MTDDLYAPFEAEVKNWKPAKEEPRPGSAEFYFAQGVAAFLARRPLSTNPHEKHSFEHREWEFGWKTREFGKQNEYHEYAKARTLYAQRYCPQHLNGMLERFQEVRLRKIAALEEAWPEFPQIYDKRKGA